MIDSGTPSTTDPTTMPNGPASSPSPNCDSTIRSLMTKIAAPIKNHSPNCQFPRSELSGIRSNATADQGASPEAGQCSDDLVRRSNPVDDETGEQQRRLCEPSKRQCLQAFHYANPSTPAADIRGPLGGLGPSVTRFDH